MGEVRDEFITGWGALGSAWGINRTMAQIHALLVVSPQPLSTDEIMEELRISRGNAHGNLRELVSWSLVRSVVRKGERKEFFQAEKDVWKMFCTIARERKRREIAPTLEVLDRCLSATKGMATQEARAFHAQMEELHSFVSLADRALEAVSKSERSKIAQLAQRVLL
ncbi:hypothetical protein BH23VER1_BH23VER1_20290 [soil metagenome]